MARFRASGQSKTKFCAANAISRSTFILWEQRLTAGDDGDEAPPPSGSGLFAEVTDAGALVTDPASRRGLEDGRGWPGLPDLRERRPGEGEWELEIGLAGIAVLRIEGAGGADDAGPREPHLVLPAADESDALVRRAVRAGANPSFGRTRRTATGTCS